MPERRYVVLAKWRKWLRRRAPRHPLSTALVWVVECGERRWLVRWDARGRYRYLLERF